MMNRWIRLIPVLATLAVVSTALAQSPALSPEAAPADTPAAGQTADEPTSSMLEEMEFSSLWEQNTLVNWLMLLGAIFAGLVAGKFAQSFLRKVGQTLEKRDARIRAHLFNDLAGPATLALFTLGLALGLRSLTMSEELESFSNKLIQTLIAVAAFWYPYNLIAVIDVPLRRLLAKTESPLDDMIAPMVRKALRVFLVVLAVLFILDAVFEKDIGAWLAGLGIAGLAISLAAQDSLKSLFGSMTILLDQPFVVGASIRYGDTEGIVEEIGFRSIKMRTVEGHLMTIPNSSLVNDPVTMMGPHPFIRRKLNVTITYDTPPEKVRRAVEIIREIFRADGVHQSIHDVDDPDNPENHPPRVYFSDFNADSLNIVVYYWFRPADWWQYLEHAQRFNQMLLERFNEAGIEFAFPTQTLYLAGDEKRPLNPETKRSE